MTRSKPLRWCIFFAALFAVTLVIWIVGLVLGWGDYYRGVSVGTISAGAAMVLMAELRL